MLMAALQMTCHAEEILVNNTPREYDVPDDHLLPALDSNGIRMVNDDHIISIFFANQAIALQCGEDSVNSIPSFMNGGRQAKLACISERGTESNSARFECGPKAQLIIVDCGTAKHRLCDQAMESVGSQKTGITEVGYMSNRPKFKGRNYLFVIACEGGAN